MLLKRTNLLETIRGGNPDRYVNQFEFLELVRATPYSVKYPRPEKGGSPVVDGWGVTYIFPDHLPAQMPIHDIDHIVIKDITRWRDYVKAPDVVFSPKDWKPFVKQAEAVDRSEKFVAAFVLPGIFETCHNLLEITNCLMQLSLNPEPMHDLIEFLTDWEISYAREIIKYIKPDALLHHDDWGSSTNSFMSPKMFKDFFEPAYKRLYGFYRDNGVELIVHHSDSYAANLVPSMIEMGIDIWQGAISSNNIPEVIQNYGGQITIMGGIDNSIVDTEGWTQEFIDEVVMDVCEKNGTRYFIPSTVEGGPRSIYPGVYEASAAAIEKASARFF